MRDNRKSIGAGLQLHEADESSVTCFENERYGITNDF